MTVGEGLLWSTVVVVVFVSVVLITKHKRWRTFWKGIAVVAVLGGVLAFGIWLYLAYDGRPQVMTSLNGINLEMSEVDVTLAKGEPDQVSELDKTPDGYRKFLLYKGSYDSYTYAILRGPLDSMRVSDICDKGGYGKVLGFGDYTSERDLVEKLGEPSTVSINQDGTEKLVTYPQWNAAFGIAKGSVTKVCVTNRREMRYKSEYGTQAKESGLRSEDDAQQRVPADAGSPGSPADAGRR